MATQYPPAWASNYIELVGIVDGDSIDMNSTSIFNITTSTILIANFFANGTFAETNITNSSITTPIFPKLQNSSSYWSTNESKININGAQITLGTADGITADIEYTLPLDANSDKYIAVGQLLIDGNIWTQVTNLTDFHSDERWEHFIHDFTNNKVIFWDGTNWKIPSWVVSISNIEMQCNSGQIDTSATKFTLNNAILSNPDLRTGWIWNATNGSIYNSTQRFEASLEADSQITSLSYVWNGSNNSRFRIPRTSKTAAHWKIRFTTESTSSTEVFTDNWGYADGADIRVDCTVDLVTQFSRVQLQNNWGTIDNLKIFWWGSSVIELTGANGTIDTLHWSTWYKRTYTIPYSIIFCRNSNTVNQTINNFIRVGTEAWVWEMEQFLRITEWNLNIKNAVFPADSQFDELGNFSWLSFGTIDNIEFNGTCNSGSRDINIFAPIGWRYSNIRVANDTNFGNQSEIRAEYFFVSCNGITFNVWDKMPLSIVYKATDFTSGQVVLQPFLDTSYAGSELLAGISWNVVSTQNSFYLLSTTEIVKTQTTAIEACGRPTVLTINWSNAGNFDIEFRMRLASWVFSGAYQAMTLANLQSTYDSLSLSQSSQWFIEYTVQRTTGTGTSDYIRGIYIDVPIDETFRWTEPPVDTNVSVTWLVAGSNVALLDSSGNVLLNSTIAGTSTSINVNTYIYNPAGGYTIKVRKPWYLSLVFSLTDTGTVGLPTSQVLRIDDGGLQVYWRWAWSAVNITLDYVNHTYDTSDEGTTEDRNDYIQDQSITDAAMATTVWLNFWGRDALMERYWPSAWQVWMVKRASAGDINARWDAQLTRADNALLSPVNEVNGTVYRSVKWVRNGVDTQLVINAVNDLWVSLKGAEDKDLTEVFNNSPTIDVNAIVDEIDVRHGSGLYNRIWGWVQNNVWFKNIRTEIEELKDILSKIEKKDVSNLKDMLRKWDKDDIMDFIKLVSIKSDISEIKISQLLEEIKKQKPKKTEVKKKKEKDPIKELFQEIEVESLWDEILINQLFKWS